MSKGLERRIEHYSHHRTKRYQATYTDPIDGAVTHYWQFEDDNIDSARERAKEGILQRHDGYVDVLSLVEEIS